MDDSEKTSSGQSRVRHIANLWTLMQHPTASAEWSLETKLKAIKDVGFDGVCWAPSPELRRGCDEHGLIFVGGMASGEAASFPELLLDLQTCGAHHVNVQLASDSVLTPEALQLTLSLMEHAKPLALLPAIETHRATCTETPEKTYALADAYRHATGELLPISWDFSHAAVVKHLVPSNFVERLLLRPDLIQHAQQFHMRPFNGHHAQVPITNGHGELTQEVLDWFPFAEALLRCWWQGNRDTEKELFLCPELGPVDGGYALSTFPNSWDDAIVLRREVARLWDEITISGV